MHTNLIHIKIHTGASLSLSPYSSAPPQSQFSALQVHVTMQQQLLQCVSVVVLMVVSTSEGASDAVLREQGQRWEVGAKAPTCASKGCSARKWGSTVWSTWVNKVNEAVILVYELWCPQLNIFLPETRRISLKHAWMNFYVELKPYILKLELVETCWNNEFETWNLLKHGSWNMKLSWSLQKPDTQNFEICWNFWFQTKFQKKFKQVSTITQSFSHVSI